MDIETVTIKNDAAPSGKTTINKCDFDPKVHELFDAPKPAKKQAPKKAARK